ncbi:UNVERIFIED_CONTAM: hypothetical protein RMT77_006514 [Armadillidium vulgare]
MTTITNSQEEATIDDQTTEDGDPKNPSIQQESAYGSLESSSNGQSQKSFSGSGSKSLNSGSSLSSGFGDQSDFKGIRLQEAKHISLRKKQSTEVATDSEVKVSTDSEANSKENVEPNTKSEENVQDSCNSPKKENRTEPEVLYPSQNDPGEDPEGRQTSLVYTQALNYIRKIKERSAEQGVPFASPHLEHLTSERQDIADLFKSFISSRGFTVAISIHDGSVLQVSSSITDILGFPKDMLLGQSFIDFVYPKDSINFSSKIINGLNMPFRNSSIKDNYGTTFFCRLRKYHGLKKTGFGVRNKKTLYKACKIIFKSQDAARFTESLNADIVHLSLIIAEIIPIESAYKDGEELSTLGSFSIRHSASCNFSEYDPEAIPYLGHLPQDLTGNSIFECYHPEDMKKLKKIYEEIVHHQGKPYRSEPYRFRTFNNSWVTLMTEWLCFVNPWTKRIESIIGQHRVLKPPKDTDVFLDPTDKNLSPLPEEILIEAQTAQNEILELLTKPVTSYQDPSKEPMVKRRRTLADIMSPFVEELDNIEKKNSNDGAQPCHQVPYSSTKKSVGVSLVSDNLQNSGTPVHKSGAWHCQSGVTNGQESLNSSIETPSSYGQLNYSATLQRFFCSNPKTVSSDESGESKMETSHQDSLGFSTSGSANRKSQSQSHSQSQSGSGSGSGDNNCDSNSFRKSGNLKIKFAKDEGNSEAFSNEDRPYMLPLTEEILLKHNQNMQKHFMESQRKNERIISTTKYNNKVKSFKKLSKKTRERSYGLKKSGSAKGGCDGSGTNRQTLPHSCTEYSNGSNKPSLLNTIKSSAQANSGTNLDRTFNSPMISRPSSELPDGRSLVPDDSGSFQRIMPSYYISNTNGPTASTSKETVPQPCLPSGSIATATTSTFAAPQLMMNHQPTYFPSQTLPVQYVGGIPGVFYQPIGPPLFNTPPVMLPNLIFQHTLIQPSMNHISVPILPDERKYGGEIESEQETLDPIHLVNKNNQTEKQVVTLRRPDSQATSVKAEPGSVRGSNASASCKVNAAESIRSYVDDLSLLHNIPLSKQDRSQTPNYSQVSQFSQSTSVIAELESVRSPEKQENKTIEDNETRYYNSSDMIMSMESAPSSPNYDKFVEDSPSPSARNQGEKKKDGNTGTCYKKGSHSKPVLSQPSWIEDIKVTPELLLRYQLQTNELVDVLRQDMDLLKKTKQPSCVDDQLASLYCELELEGESPELHLEEGITTSSSSDDQQAFNARQHHSQRVSKRPSKFYSKMSMLHEEEAPMPASDELGSSS